MTGPAEATVDASPPSAGTRAQEPTAQALATQVRIVASHNPIISTVHCRGEGWPDAESLVAARLSGQLHMDSYTAIGPMKR